MATFCGRKRSNLSRVEEVLISLKKPEWGRTFSYLAANIKKTHDMYREFDPNILVYSGILVFLV
jgi:hypothetical protein